MVLQMERIDIKERHSLVVICLMMSLITNLYFLQ